MTISAPPAESQIQAREGRPLLSIIIPAHNEENRLSATLERILAYLADQPYGAEIVVVENGSTDRTAAVVEGAMAGTANVRLIRNQQRGKGGAVKRGMLEARGDYCFLCDADLSMPITELVKFFPPALDGCDIAIGSRETPGARRFGEPAHRHAMGRIYACIVQVLTSLEYKDTQCGFKLFRRDIVPPLFASQTVNGWGFDPELLYIASKWGYRVAEVPIDWYYDADSRVRPIRDALRMIGDLLRIRWNDLRGRYTSEPGDGPFRAPAKPVRGIGARSKP